MSAEFRLCVSHLLPGSLTQSCLPVSFPELLNALLWRCLLKGLQVVFFSQTHPLYLANPNFSNHKAPILHYLLAASSLLMLVSTFSFNIFIQ